MESYKRTRKEKLDDLYFETINKLRYVKFLYEKTFKGKHKQLEKNIELKDIHKGKRCFVIGNGPSINNQDLTLLKDEIVFMVNRAFLDPRYEAIKPTYHVIVDPKLSTGEWPITFLDEIVKKNPNVTFLLNSSWCDIDIFQPYKEKCKIYWIDQSLNFTPFIENRKIDLRKRTYSKFVVEQGITVAIYMGLKGIYFTGVEGNGLAYLMMDKSSHSYGVNKEDLDLKWENIARSYQSGSYWLKSWNSISQYCKLNNIQFYNLTIGGIMTMTERKDFDSIVTKK
jgi:hypothetical protein